MTAASSNGGGDYVGVYTGHQRRRRLKDLTATYQSDNGHHLNSIRLCLYSTLVVMMFITFILSKDISFTFSQYESTSRSIGGGQGNNYAGEEKYTEIMTSEEDNQKESVEVENMNEEYKNTDFDLHWPQLKDKLCSDQRPNPTVWLKLFQMARFELGFASNRIDLIDTDTTSKNFIERFYTFSSGGIRYASPNREQYMVYLRIFKCANDQIIGNLNHTLRQQPGAEVTLAMDRMTRKNIFNPIPKTLLPTTCIVTAIRDPVDHFLSGYNEMEFRNTRDNVQRKGEHLRTHYSRFANGTSARFEQFVVDLIGGALNHLNDISHVFSMSGVLWYLKSLEERIGYSPQLTSYLPSLVDINDEFPKLLNKTCPGLPPAAVDSFPFKTKHDSSSDQFGFYTGAKEAMKDKESPVSRAICAIHAMDYACYDELDVPERCQGVFGSQKFHDTLLNS